MQSDNTILDSSNSAQEISSRISALKTSAEVLRSEARLKSSVGNSFTKSSGQITSQLDKIKNLQKRYQREPPNSFDQLLNFISQTRGQGPETLTYLRKKLLEVTVKMEPKISAIIQEESIKALGCSQEQTYKGISLSTLEFQPLPTIPQSPNDGFLYIPVQSVDFFSNLKNSPNSQVGKVYYETPDPSASSEFKPFGGFVNFPMNKQLYRLMEPSNRNRSLSQILGKNYAGRSGQSLFDIQYTNTNQFGVSGDFFRVALINRQNNNSPNKVGQFISDYYNTIRIADSVNIGAQIVNILSGVLSIKGEVGFGELQKESKFGLIVQRILGLCFDNRREIDVSGVAKVGELDGVDESFFELNEIDLRNIDAEVSNIQNGVMEFQDCENVKVPVDVENLVSQLIEFRNLTGQTVEQEVSNIEQIIDSISQNPDWNVVIPNNFNASMSINTQALKKLPLAIASAILSPKVLLPIFCLMAATQNQASFTYNQTVTSANTATSATVSSTNNIITDGSDFLRKWKTFSIGLITRINAEFLKTLFDILKKDILLLLNVIVRDVARTQALKKYAIILRLIEVSIVVARLINDYRRCKSLLGNILYLLNLINSRPQSDIPLPLLAAAKFLPGFSPQRATINVIEELQQLGIPTGTLPDGSPNLMLLYNLASNKGFDKERRNEKITTINTGIIGYGVPQ